MTFLDAKWHLGREEKIPPKNVLRNILRIRKKFSEIEKEVVRNLLEQTEALRILFHFKNSVF